MMDSDKYEVLKNYFGYSSFREGQECLIDAIMSGRDTLGIMPTGAGKSLCYQIPALLLSGVTIVISPLISLMKDQVEALRQSGVPAAFLNSSMTSSEYSQVLFRARQGEYKLLYLAPERLSSEGFLQFAREADISMVTIDEAHCVSQWGQDFRPHYLLIPQFIRMLSEGAPEQLGGETLSDETGRETPIGPPAHRPVVSAFTATATPEVAQDIAKLLELTGPFILTTGFDRKNLSFEVRQPRDKLAALLQIVEPQGGRSGIVYCLTRKNVEEVCEFLCAKGFPATRYHAGLSDEERSRNQEDFLYDRQNVMVATNAFGMGIDKSNVSFVIHFNMPKNIESYYQEAGRAGRDGEPASCILLYGGQDVITNQFLIDHGNERDELDPETQEIIRERDRQRLRAMTFYCHTRDCLRGYILKYFGEKAPDYCGNCSNCLQNFEETDITIEAQKILSCVVRTGQRYGAKMLVDVLRGSKNDKVLRARLDRQSTYGIMKDEKEAAIREIIRFLDMEGFLDTDEGPYPILHLGSRAAEVLKERRPLSMKRKIEAEPAAEKPAKRSGDRTKEETAEPVLFESLRELRQEIAERQGVPAYLVFTNAALADMCARLPRDHAEFLEVSGVGQAKLEKYGELFLEVINAYLDE